MKEFSYDEQGTLRQFGFNPAGYNCWQRDRNGHTEQVTVSESYQWGKAYTLEICVGSQVVSQAAVCPNFDVLINQLD